MGVLVQILCTLGLFTALAVSAPNTNGKRVVCYLGSWAVYRSGLGKITADDIDCSLCTHFIYSFVGLEASSGQVILLDAYNDIGDEWKVGLLPTLQKKCRASGTKFMVAIGGWNEGSAKYSAVMSDPAKRAAFKNNIISFVEKFGLDGFDLDWEYPGDRGGAPYDKDNLALFLDDLYPAFVQKGWELSAAVSANAEKLSTLYNVKHLSDHLSFINVMTYDLHGSWEPITGHHTALYATPDDAPDAKNLNIESAIRKWLELGAAPEKLNLGLATYGRSFTLLNPSQNKIGAPSGGLAPSGWVPEAGFYGYNELCYNNKTEWTSQWDDDRKVPYAYNGNKWVAYDDPTSIALKVCLGQTLNLGGIMYWSLETTDFKGLCKQGKYPLIHAGINALANGCESNGGSGSNQQEPATSTEVEEQETSAPEAPQTIGSTESTETPSEPTSTNPITKNQCETEGQLLRDPENCSQFLICMRGADGVLSVLLPMKCPTSLVYDPNIKACNYKSAYSC